MKITHTKRRRRKPAARPGKPTVTFTRGARLSEATDEWAPAELKDEFPEISDVKKRAFLIAMATTPRIGKACKMAGVTPRTAYDWRRDESDPLFIACFQKAYMLGMERAESELWRRGVEGVEEGVWHQGQLVGSKKVYSDTALIFGLKGGLPEKYAEQRRIAAPGGGPVQTESRTLTVEMTDEELRQRLDVARETLLAGTRGPDIQATATTEDPLEVAYAKRLAERHGSNGSNGNG